MAGTATKTARDCGTCGGTGSQYLNRSWFKADGYRRVKCSICGGTGESSYRDDPDFVRHQASRRASSEAERD